MLRISGDSPMQAYAMLVDINDFSSMVQRAVEGSSHGEFIAQFVRDILLGVVEAIESHEGEIVGIMGDAVLGIFPENGLVMDACIGIARTLNRECRHISEHQRIHPHDWEYALGGPTLKICIEFGWIGVADMATRQLGTHHLLIGPPVNYASRISHAGSGNRCLLGPVAAHMPEFAIRQQRGPFHVRSKSNEVERSYYELNLSAFWVEGAHQPDVITYCDEPPDADIRGDGDGLTQSGSDANALKGPPS